MTFPRVFTCILIFLSLYLPASNRSKVFHAATSPQVLLTSPIDGSITYASIDQPKALPRFVWQPVAGAIAYRLEISRDTSFTPGTLLVEVPATASSTWTPADSNLPEDVLLYWRVRVEEQAGTTEKGAYSTTWSFRKDWRRTGPDPSARNAAALLLPEDGASLAFSDAPGGDARPAFSWSPVLGATHYVFQVSQEPDFDPLSGQETTIGTTLQPASKLADGDYYWRVVPMQAGDPPLQGDPGDARRVTFNYHAQHLPQLLEPANHAVVEFNPTFRWTAVRGAQKYVLQYATSSSFPESETTQVETYASRYTPSEFVNNHTRYYWRVRVVSGSSDAPQWTPFFIFDRAWDQKPGLLAPANGFLYASDPYFTWTPVPGAAEYTLEVDDNAEFSSPLAANDIRAPFYAFHDPLNNCPPFEPDFTLLEPMRVFWRVVPRDASEQPGTPSDIWTFVCNPAAGAPAQVYPEIYYPSAVPQANPRQGNIAPLPVFLWKRVLTGAEQTQAAAYRIQVAEAPDFEPPSIRFSLDTENMNAVPAQADLLPHNSGQADYYWRVRPLTGLGGAETGQWSQVWRMRYNTALLPAATGVIQPLRPAAGSEWVETMPVFEWMPLQGATVYKVQLGLDTNFEPALAESTVGLPAYSFPSRLPAGTYYWRVCGLDALTQACGWSQPVQFHIAAQSRWRPTRTLGENNSPVIAAPPQAGAGTNLVELTNLSVTQGGPNVYIGFQAGVADDRHYEIYIDTDRLAGSGGKVDPGDYDVTALPIHLPEMVISIDKINGMVNENRVYVYSLDRYNTGGWLISPMYRTAGAGITYASGYLEFTFPMEVITRSPEKNSLSIAVLSLLPGGGRPLGSLPYDPGIHPGPGGTNQVSRFAAVSDRVTLLAQPYWPGSSALAFASTPALTWQPLVEVPSAGCYTLRVGTDPGLTGWLSTSNQTKSSVFTFPQGIAGDAAYYWQVRPEYSAGCVPESAHGGWSQAGSFAQTGTPVQGLTITNNLWSPVLSWNLAEGAYSYTVEIDDDVDFAYPPVHTATTKTNTYTPDSVTFLGGKAYYARIHTNQPPLTSGPVSNAVAFAVQFPPVTHLRTIPDTTAAAPAQGSLTYCWDPVGPAWKYLLEVFTSTTLAVTTEQSCYTFPVGLPDGAFSWRVTPLDGALKAGLPSTAAQAWKRYPAPELIVPTAPVDGTPLFRWSAVRGADRYYLEISDTPNFAAIRYAVTTVNNEHQPMETLDFGMYYWRVKMIDRDRVEGPFSDMYTAYKVFLPDVRR